MDTTSRAGDLIDLVLFFLRGWKTIFVCAAIAGVIAIGWALLADPVYRADIVVAPAPERDGGAAGLAAQFGGLAALAGIDLGGQSSKEEVIAFLRSRDLAMDFIRQNSLLPVLFASRWDAASKAWKKDEPTLGDAYLVFDERVRNILEDRRTGMVTVRVEWTDRERAAQWANGLVKLANERLRERAIRDSNERIRYLESEAQKSSGVELRDAIYRLIESEVKSRMIASVHPEFALRVVDPAVVPDADKRVRPWRSLMVVAGSLAGVLIGIAILLIQRRLRERAAG
jgi:uncharacterized protein involved in exopolysaccharide biosynthesis